MTKLGTFFILSGILIMTGCSSNNRTIQNSAAGQAPAPAVAQAPDNGPPPPNHAKIRGRIISVYPDLDKNAPDDPCGKVPCRAAVLIDSVLAHGAGYSRPFGLGEIVDVHFVFTLSATSPELFPNLDKRLPGLSEGGKFIANIEAQRATSSNGDQVNFVIYDYSVQ